MRSYNNNIKRANPFVLLNVSIYILSAICLMIYATQQSYVHADENLGYDITSANASVTVGTACTFTATVDNEHNATIANGIYSTDIGKTTLNTICNDSGGYAVYAIGYTEDTYGATDLASNISSTYNISTGTNTSGDSSSWAMKLSPEPGTTTATIENGYNNYNIVPDDYTKVASLNTVTDNTSTTSTTGSSISTTYQTYISPTQPAGTYTGKVKYTLVHPSAAPAPTIPDISKLTYLQDFATLSPGDKKAILASMPEGQQYTLKDNRDEKEYYIAKLADGNVWMTQNLDLDIVAGKTYTSADTDLAYSSIGTTWTPTSSTSTTSSWTSSYTAPSSYDPGNLYWDGTLNTNWDGNLNNETVADPSDTPGGVHYHIGNYYNWTAAVAMSDSSSYLYGNVNQSICPAGWQLPSERLCRNLRNAQGLSAGNRGNIQNNPTYYIYGGSWYGSSSAIGSVGNYFSSAPEGVSRAIAFIFNATISSIYSGDPINRDYGRSLRCVAR